LVERFNFNQPLSHAQNSSGISGDLVLIPSMSRGALLLALGLFGVCLPLAAQQGRNSKTAHHAAVSSAVTAFDGLSTLSFYRPKIFSASESSLLFHTGPVRAWSDGAQLASETALAQIGMAPLGLFPVAYLAPNYSGPAPVPNRSTASVSRPQAIAVDGKDLPGDMISSPLNQVYYTGEVGFMYGQASGKGGGNYLDSYVWGQAGNEKFQITAGAAYENWNGNGVKFRSFPVPR
jgi:hypothetical protein